MARPLDENKRNAILAATTALIAERGLGASTAEIAKLAQIPHGSVFTYFGTKVDLFNALYVELKSELAQAIMEHMPTEADAPGQFGHLWAVWVNWGVDNSSKRRALAQLSLSEDITDLTRKAVAEVSGPAVDVVRRLQMEGALKSVPSAYIGALVDTMAGTTIDFIAKRPGDADAVRAAGLEVLVRALK
jgi:AcrR family transcriptional regulator